MVKKPNDVRVVSVGSLRAIQTLLRKGSDSGRITTRVRYRRIGLIREIDRILESETDDRVKLPRGFITQLLIGIFGLVRFSSEAIELINTVMGTWKK